MPDAPRAHEDMASAKRAARAAARSAIGALSPSRRRLASLSICQRVMAAGAFARVRTVMLFAPLPDEVDLTPILRRCRQTGRRVCAGRPDWTTRSMEPAEVPDDGDTGEGGWSAMTTTRFGVREPGRDAPGVPIAELDLVLVPGLAFDPHGFRLGRGGGFYDRFLAREEVAAAWVVGVGFAAQLVSSVPRDPHDRPVHAVITEREIVVQQWGG